MTAEGRSITLRHVVSAARDRVFEAFSRADAVTQWLTPSPDITVDVLAFVFEPGGHFRLRYNNPDGSKSVVGGVYERIARPEELAFSWIWEGADPQAGLETRVQVRFLEAGDQTEIVLTHERLPTQEACDRHAAGWRGALEGLPARWLDRTGD